MVGQGRALVCAPQVLTGSCTPASLATICSVICGQGRASGEMFKPTSPCLLFLHLP